MAFGVLCIVVLLFQWSPSFLDKLQLLWMGVCMAFVGALPQGDLKKWLHYQVYTSCFQILGGSLSAVITYHNAENKPKQGICVANHTSPIDVLILACDNAYALVSNKYFLGLAFKS